MDSGYSVNIGKPYGVDMNNSKEEEEIKFLTDWYDCSGVESLIQLVAKRHLFMNKRCKIYRAKLQELGVDISLLVKDE